MKIEGILITKIKEEEMKKIEDIVHYMNMRNQLHNKPSEIIEVEDFIVSAVSQSLSNIKNYYAHVIQVNKKELAPFKIRNNFKTLLSNANETKTRKELSNMLSIDSAVMSQILNNKSQPSLDSMFRLWTYLNHPSLEEMFTIEICKS